MQMGCSQYTQVHLISPAMFNCYFDNNQEFMNKVKEQKDILLRIDNEKGLNSKYLDCILHSGNVISIEKCGNEGVQLCSKSSDCNGNSSCVEKNNVNVCNCLNGYKGNGLICEDIDECIANTHNCDKNSTCKNTEGAFECICNEFYTWNGTNCVDIDECTTNKHNCEKGFKCTNKEKGFECEDIDECTETPEVCQKYCTNKKGGFDCFKIIESDKEDMVVETNAITYSKSGNIFIMGSSRNKLDKNQNDIFITKFDSNGNKLWIKKWDIKNYFSEFSTFIDSSENIFITGETNGELDGNSCGITKHGCSNDVFLIKLDKNGNKLFTKQWGTTEYDSGFSISIDNLGNIFITGSTWGGLDGNTNSGFSDIFLTKFDKDGNKQWTKQWGSVALDEGKSLVIDNSGNVFITGYTRGGLDGNLIAKNIDIFLTKLDNDGNKLWTKQWSNSMSNSGKSLVVDNSGNIFITGWIFGMTNSKMNDIFLTKLDKTGNKLWTKQWGTKLYDKGNSIFIDIKGNLFVIGETQGKLDENIDSGKYDAFLTKFDNDGNKLWTKQWGTKADDTGKSVAVNNLGNIILTGKNIFLMFVEDK